MNDMPALAQAVHELDSIHKRGDDSTAVKNVRIPTLARLVVAFALTLCIGRIVSHAADVDKYGELTGKTVLAPSGLKPLPESLLRVAPDQTNAAALFEKQFADSGIVVVNDGPCFVRLLPKEASQAYKGNAPLRGAELHGLRTQAVMLMPKGAVQITGADVSTVLDLYADAKRRTILRPSILPSRIVNLITQTAITRDELVYAIETVLALNGVTTVDDGNSFVQVVPTDLPSHVLTRAPAAKPGTSRFEPKMVPSMGHTDLPRVQSKLQHELEKWQAAVAEFLQMHPQRDSSAQALLELYAKLSDTTAEPSRTYETTPIWFHVTTPLDRSELLYAVTTTFALNGLKVETGANGNVRLVRGRINAVDKTGSDATKAAQQPGR